MSLEIPVALDGVSSTSPPLEASPREKKRTRLLVTKRGTCRDLTSVLKGPPGNNSRLELVGASGDHTHTHTHTRELEVLHCSEYNGIVDPT